MALRTGAVVVVSGRPHEHRVVRVVVGHGEMTERPNVAVLKTAVRLAHRGFESPSLRHVMLTRTLGSNSAAEGLFMFVARQGDGSGDGGG